MLHFESTAERSEKSDEENQFVLNGGSSPRRVAPWSRERLLLLLPQSSSPLSCAKKAFPPATPIPPRAHASSAFLVAVSFRAIFAIVYPFTGDSQVALRLPDPLSLDSTEMKIQPLCVVTPQSNTLVDTRRGNDRTNTGDALSAARDRGQLLLPIVAVERQSPPASRRNSYHLHGNCII